MRCTDEDKTKWQKCADFQGIPLSKWITFALDRHARRTEHYIRVDPPEREWRKQRMAKKILPDIIQSLSQERQRLLNNIATKEKEFKQAKEALERFDQESQDIRAWTSLV